MWAGVWAGALAGVWAGAQALRSDSPDLMIVDVRLGEYNGLQLIITAERRIPSIVLTGYADPVVEDEARHEGAEYLVKPIETQTLLDLVKKLLPS